MTADLELKKKYKRYMWLRWICFVLAIVACAVPAIVAACYAAPSVQKNVRVLDVSAFGLCMAALIAFGTAKSAIRELAPRLPFTVRVLIVELIVLGLLVSVRLIINDAILILGVSVIGAAVGFVFNLISYFCKLAAIDVEKEYYRTARSDDDV